MVRIVRHISVRFWLTTLMVLPSGFVLFPRLSGWLSDMPASVFIALMYLFCGLGLGIFMDVAGLWRIKGLVRDAQLWERSGIATRAEKKFIRAVRIYDSAWISPLAARRAEPMLISSLARFYLASGSRRREIQGAASAWLAQNPKDKSLARFWLERIQDQDVAGTFTQSILTVLADSWYADPELCRIVVDVFLDQGRMDFSARRLYRSFLDMIDMTGEGNNASQQDKVRAEMIRDMMSERLDTPEPEPEMIEPGLGTLGDERVDSTIFIPGDQEGRGPFVDLTDQAFEDGPAGWRPEDDIYTGQQTSGRVSALLALLSGIGRKAAGGGSFIADRTGKAKYAVLNLIQAREKWWGRVRGVMIACLGVWLIFFVWGTLSHMFKTAEQPARQINIVITKPFTIQVAAYHKKAHADRYMATLAQKGLKATMKVTDGGGKTWYLVHVSEFTDQKSAQAYGNRLKTDHIIDEFFVTKN
ncbi:SPOR domain-containing protein [Desulfobacter hydrogenophilus]|uniref:SPOR domain-containing protein n=1 Tax=Desulfobacter hydrogenophilus TaxID=2291 RepID=A0A328FH75_9BACT|nr:SPOR domain-containing protein [Desulfobacter hydrogenophilus]NDY71678.1 SPOR domain-containing protein [Desulfobacter hydrogenophilus]QBH13191.1 SPOR domain-containing protein [Desulfobacter hydrogenophilus]RAM02387.1 SPOR domain-containing protein [Desulfobacter hydrogenophilus]